MEFTYAVHLDKEIKFFKVTLEVEQDNARKLNFMK